MVCAPNIRLNRIDRAILIILFSQSNKTLSVFAIVHRLSREQKAERSKDIRFIIIISYIHIHLVVMNTRKKK